VDGLAELARTPGGQQADAYRDWIDAVVRAGRLDEAEHAAAEALDRLEPEGRVVAAIAQRRALLAAGAGDDAAVLAAHRTAWRADPTLERLLALVDVATACGELDTVLAAEAGRAGAEPLARRAGLAAGCCSSPAASTTRSGSSRRRTTAAGAWVTIPHPWSSASC
jgi:hypothetical protein